MTAGVCKHVKTCPTINKTKHWIEPCVFLFFFFFERSTHANEQNESSSSSCPAGKTHLLKKT